MTRAWHSPVIICVTRLVLSGRHAFCKVASSDRQAPSKWCQLLPQLLNSLLSYSAALASLPAAIWGKSMSLSRLASLSFQAGDNLLMVLQHSRPSSFCIAR